MANGLVKSNQSTCKIIIKKSEIRKNAVNIFEA
jgi:hypothetical protein